MWAVLDKQTTWSTWNGIVIKGRNYTGKLKEHDDKEATSGKKEVDCNLSVGSAESPGREISRNQPQDGSWRLQA